MSSDSILVSNGLHSTTLAGLHIFPCFNERNLIIFSDCDCTQFLQSLISNHYQHTPSIFQTYPSFSHGITSTELNHAWLLSGLLKSLPHFLFVYNVALSIDVSTIFFGAQNVSVSYAQNHLMLNDLPSYFGERKGHTFT